MSLQEKNEDNQSKKTFTQIAIKIEKQIKNLCIEKFTESPCKKLNHFLKKQRFLADIKYLNSQWYTSGLLMICIIWFHLNHLLRSQGYLTSFVKVTINKTMKAIVAKRFSSKGFIKFISLVYLTEQRSIEPFHLVAR